MKADVFKKILIAIIVICVASFGIMVAYTCSLYGSSSVTSVISNEE